MRKTLCIFVILVVMIAGCTNKNLFGSTEKKQIVEGTPIKAPIGGQNASVEERVNAEDLFEDINQTELTERSKEAEENSSLNKEAVIDSISEAAKSDEGYIRLINSEVPGDIKVQLEYNKYTIHKNYGLVLSKGVNIREKPTSTSSIVGTAGRYEKLRLVSEVRGEYSAKYGNDVWLKVAWSDNSSIRQGYVLSGLLEQREFQFLKMQEAINLLKISVDSSNVAFISNYKNRNGKAPLYKGSTIDSFGIRRYQSAPAYVAPSLKSDFRYIADGALVNILEDAGEYFKVSTYNFEGIYYVPKNYISLKNTLTELRKVIVVDRKNQNEGVFEYRDNVWNLVSYVYATTGENAKHKLPTDLGYYMLIEKRDRFLYLDDETKQVAGYAPYAVRFSGGTYIHGVPVEYKAQGQKLVDPGIKEYLLTIGTIPRSHKCVRNYTSHAKFIYEWSEIGKTIVVVLE